MKKIIFSSLLVLSSVCLATSNKVICQTSSGGYQNPQSAVENASTLLNNLLKQEANINVSAPSVSTLLVNHNKKLTPSRLYAASICVTLTKKK